MSRQSASMVFVVGGVLSVSQYPCPHRRDTRYLVEADTHQPSARVPCETKRNPVGFGKTDLKVQPPEWPGASLYYFSEDSITAARPI
ncbi:hypothetical protein FA15DRAFT_666130 [Coprinopsis marcescibilis]|uniref:Uncharacterized protein n=1 Tax=Coprinopsis marcescibilis TaxID=230819 RepID=A0A5C3L4Y4_COPMA|nr:hypothetical protein FA15DRAFT_666130 [Coprinopsis marcescibilis]